MSQYPASENQLAKASERIEHKLNLILKVIKPALPMTDEDRAAIDIELHKNA